MSDSVTSTDVLGRVLVVDDVALNRRVLSGALRKDGYQVTTTDNGEDALVIAKQHLPEVILLDIVMPGISGIETCRRLKQIRECEEIPVIMVSGKDEADDVIEALDAGAHDYVQKPYNLRIVAARTRSALRMYRSLRHVQMLNQQQEEDLRAAAQVQQSLLPQGDIAIPGYRCAWHYQPCEHLAGDIFDVVRLDEEHWGIYVLDVSGHGVSSALLSVQVGRIMDPHSSGSDLLLDREDDGTVRITAPAEVLRHLNQRFPQHRCGMKYFTILYGVLHAPSGELRFASAGHPGPWVQRGEAIERVQVSGLPIGLWHEAHYDEHMLQLDSCDRIWFYSDGLIEVRNDAEDMLGPQRIEEGLRHGRRLELDIVLATLQEAYEHWQGRRRGQDDVTILAIERQALPTAAETAPDERDHSASSALRSIIQGKP